LMIEKKRVVG